MPNLSRTVVTRIVRHFVIAHVIIGVCTHEGVILLSVLNPEGRELKEILFHIEDSFPRGRAVFHVSGHSIEILPVVDAFELDSRGEVITAIDTIGAHVINIHS